jgi:uncharacterized membrane protein
MSIGNACEAGSKATVSTPFSVDRVRSGDAHWRVAPNPLFEPALRHPVPSVMLTLIGIVIVVVGFAIGLNPLLVVTVAGIATGIASGREPIEVLALFGKAFIDNRYVAIVWLVLPVIGLLERSGLKERARDVVSNIKVATAGRVLLAYLALRQVTAALGLVSLGGHPQMVRPLIAPMAEGAAEHTFGTLTEAEREEIRANAAAVDNVGVFFGEDIFIAIGSILLIKGFLEQNGIVVEPAKLAIWAVPTALCAFVVHGTRLLLLDRRLSKARREGGDVQSDVRSDVRSEKAP